ncbi:MAG: hypothetical protein ABWY06_07775 [Pseudomonas sp.]|uniref:WD40 repeat domain-containing protein n=1 Tax=Pseudomonas sp. TaxID=306 RepID=UPI0033956E9F
MNNIFSIICMLFALAGCQTSNDETYRAQQASAPQLKEAFSEPIALSARKLSFSDDGRYFILADSHNQVGVFNSGSREALVTLQWPTTLNMIQGAGFIDPDRYFYAVNKMVDKPTPHNVSIREVGAEQDQYYYEFEGNHGDRPIFANSSYVAYGDEMVNWHTGEKYAVRTAHQLNPRDYTLTASGRVLSSNYYSDEILLHAPLTDDYLWIDSGLSNFRSGITPSERYIIAQAYDGGCRVWPVPALKPVQSCGRGGWSDADHANIAMHPSDDSFVASAGGRVEAYRLVEGVHQQVFARTLPNAVTSLALSANHRVALGDSTGHIEVWDTELGTLLGQVDLQLDPGGHLLAFAPSGKQLLYGGASDFKVHLFDIPE